MSEYSLAAFVKNDQSAPGMSEEIYLCQKTDILLFPPVITPQVAPGDSLRLVGDITFGVGDGWVKAYATKDTVELALKKVGMKDSRGFKVELGLFVPGLNPAWAELLINDPDLVVLCKRPDCDGTQYVCLGTTCRGIEVFGDFASGKSDDEGGRHGWSGMLSGYVQRYYYYTGVITIKA